MLILLSYGHWQWQVSSLKRIVRFPFPWTCCEYSKKVKPNFNYLFSYPYRIYLENVRFHPTRVGVEEIRHHANAILPHGEKRFRKCHNKTEFKNFSTVIFSATE